MTQAKCPGSEGRDWADNGVFEAPCQHCGQTIEFFNNDTERTCPACGKDTPNPNKTSA